MHGSYNLLTGRFECSEMTGSQMGEADIHYVGNLFLNSSDEKIRLVEIADNFKKHMLLNKLSGQFAFVVHDKKGKSITFIRDQFGVYPFYYTMEDNFVFFGTTIQSILRKLKKRVRMNENVVHEYFMYRYVSDTNTMFQDIHEIRPGTALTVGHEGRTAEFTYYRFQYSNHPLEAGRSYSEEFEVDFRASLKRQLDDMETRRIGVLSSGGIDSSILVSGTHHLCRQRFNTYYIENEGYRFNRIQEVQQLSDLFNTNHKNLIVSGLQFSEKLEETIRINEEPLNHPSTVQRNLLNQDVRDEVEVLISGEGADCLFCGYYIFDIVNYAYVKNRIRPISRGLAKMIPLSLFPEPLKGKAKKIVNAFILNPYDYVMRYSEMISNRDAVARMILDLEFPDGCLASYTKALSIYGERHIMEAILAIFQRNYLVEGLNTITKIGANSGIEFRHPFIDVNLVNNFNQFPWKEKLRFFKRKHQVVELGKRYLPAAFFQKRKEGFGVPLKVWFRDENGLGRYIGLLRDKRTRERGVFHVKYLDNLLAGHENRKLADSAYERILWPIINLELWHRIFIDNNASGYK